MLIRDLVKGGRSGERNVSLLYLIIFGRATIILFMYLDIFRLFGECH